MEKDTNRFDDEQLDQTPDTAAVQDNAEAGEPVPEIPAEVDDEVNDTRYFLKLLQYMEEALSFGTSVPLTSKKLVDVEKCLLILKDMEQNLPSALAFAQGLYEDRVRIQQNAEKAAMNQLASADVRAKAKLEDAKNRADQLVDDAQDEADRIVSEAEDHANHLVDDSEIMARAREEARIMIEEARKDANQRRMRATNDAQKLFDSLEQQTRTISEELHQRRMELTNDQ